MNRPRLDIVQRKHAIERELRSLERRERASLQVLRAALEVIAEHEPRLGFYVDAPEGQS